MKYPEPKRNGQGKWDINYTNVYGGRVRRRFATLEAANETARLVWECMNKGVDPEQELLRRAVQAQARNTSLFQYYSRFLERHGGRVSANTRESYECSWRHLKDERELVLIPMVDTKPALVDAYVARRLTEGAAVSSVTTEVNLVRAMLTQAVKDGILDAHPLAKRLDLPRRDNRREVCLTFEDQARLLAAIRMPLHRDLAAFALYTGKRKGEIFGLEVRDVEILPADIHGRVYSRVTVRLKGNRYQTFVASPYATEILVRNIGEREKGPVFLSRCGEKLKAHSKVTGLDSAVRRLSLTAIQAGERVPLCFHDLRRVFAANSLSEGADLLAVSQTLGHEDIRVTQQRYTGRGDGKKIAERQRRIG